MLGVCYRTLALAADTGTLTGRMADALARHLLSNVRSPLMIRHERVAELEKRVDALEGRLTDVVEAVRSGIEALRADVGGGHETQDRRFLSEWKLLAVIYTSISVSTLFAGLAMSRERWSHVDWNSRDELSKLRVVDSACGTGTLLMAAYRQIVQNCSATCADDYDDQFLHQALVEKVITGADVVQDAIHLTAATLAAISPSVRSSNRCVCTRLDWAGTHRRRYG